MSITRLLFVFVFLSITTASFSQEQEPVTPPQEIVDSLFSENETKDAQTEITPQRDSSTIEVRAIDQSKLNEMREDPAMDYGQDSPAIISLWDRIKMWLFNALRWLFSIGSSTNWGNIVVGVVIILILTYVIMRLLKIDALKMFYGRADKVTINHSIIEENIHEMDFEKLIQEALARKEYRLAIRLLFLHGLKLLADRHHITWEPGKTNHDYLNELTSKELKTGFNELNFYFEYAWYGNFVITDELYNRVTDIFNNWKINIR
jgi:hypothetical protein